MIVIDVETTGLWANAHAIISIGAVNFEDPKNTFYNECCIWEGAAIDDQALRVNGFTREQICDPNAPSQSEVMNNLLDWVAGVEDKTLAGHHVAFDISMLRATLKRERLLWPFGHQSIDLYNACYLHMLQNGHQLPLKNGAVSMSANRVYEYVGLPREPEPHHGLTGAKMEAEAFSRLIHNRHLLPEFAKFTIPFNQ